MGTEGVRSFVEAGLIEELGEQLAAFHPFQIWPISKLLRGLDTRLVVGISHYGLAPESLKHFIDINWSRKAAHLVNFPKSEEVVVFNRSILPILLWIESYFLPVVRGPRAGVVTLVNANAAEWDEWRASINFEEWLNRHSLSVEELSKWRDRLLFSAF